MHNKNSYDPNAVDDLSALRAHLDQRAREDAEHKAIALARARAGALQAAQQRRFGGWRHSALLATSCSLLLAAAVFWPPWQQSREPAEILPVASVQDIELLHELPALQDSADLSLVEDLEWLLWLDEHADALPQG